jgi:Family of unknown function (DUF5681)
MDEQRVDPKGYKKPPRHSQFKPGQSGNPSGRPKKTGPTVSETLRKELSTLVTVTETGKPARKMPKLQAVLKQLTAKAMKGDVKSIELLIKVFDSGESDGALSLRPVLDTFRGIHALRTAENSTANQAKKDEGGPDEPD